MNTDDLNFEMLGETATTTFTGLYNLPGVETIPAADEMFISKEFRRLIEVTKPDLISGRFQHITHKKPKSEFIDFDLDTEV